MKKGDIVGIIILVVFLLVAFLYAGAVWDEKTMSSDSVNDRIALLERQMKDKVRPIIQISRATVYNTDGEIVIEGVGK